MSKRTFGCVVVLFWITSFVVVVTQAGEVFMNDTGEVAKAFHIVFSEPIEITNFGGPFTDHEPLGQASEFVFSGGEAQYWAR